MVAQNHSLDQGISFQKVSEFRIWFCLLCTLHFNMLCCSTCEIYLGCFKKTVRKLLSILLLTIDKYFTI